MEVSAQDFMSRIRENHSVYLPEGAGPFPVVIIVPGCSGVSLYGAQSDTGRPGNEDDRLFRRHWPIMAEKLRNAGYLVIIIDYLAAENVINTCGGEIPHQIVREYITASIAFAKTQEQADPLRINIIGASYGGAGLLTWLVNLTSRPEEIRSIIAIYPGCGAITKTTDIDIPVLMLLGAADDITPPEQCEALVATFSATPKVLVKTYKDSRHGFDLTEGPTVLPIGNGMTVGRNSKTGKKAWKDIFAFLKERNSK